MTLDQHTLDHYARLYFEPLTLLMNFALFQYLCGVYYKRRNEFWVRVLLGFGFAGVLFIIPFATPDERVFHHLNDVSEVCTVMTFLTQITIIGCDLHRKVKIRSLRWLTLASEVLTLVGTGFAIKGIVELSTRESHLEFLDQFDDVFEDIALWFIFFFRFYYITLSKGVRWILANRKMDLFLYGLFMTHEYPFMLLESETGLSWESIQAPWHRFTMTMCILQTIKE